MLHRYDTWAIGGAYEPYVGRWSRLVAREFLDWLAVPAGRSWLDAGCGTGAITASILSQAQPAAVTGIDPAAGFVAYARGQVPERRAAFAVGNAMALPCRDGAFDGAVVSGLVLNFIPRPDLALAEMTRVAGRRATVAAYVWDYAGQMQMLRVFWDAAVELDPAQDGLDEGQRFPICRPEPLAELFETAGLQGVAVRALDVPAHFRDFDDYWSPFLGAQGPAPGYVKSLAEEHRAALRERIRARLPIAADGSITLVARAWAARGARQQPDRVTKKRDP